MFRLIKTLIYTVTILVAGACFFIWSYRVPATRFILSTVLNNPVTIGDADISLSLSKINGRNVGIKNPARSQAYAKHAIKTRVFEFKTGFLNWFKKELIIEEIYLDRVDFFVDMYNVTGSKSNVKTIIENIHMRAQERHPEGKKHKRPVIVKKIIIHDITFSYHNPLLTAGVTTLEPIKEVTINNVGSGHPVSAAHIASIVTGALLKRFVTLSGFKHMIESIPKLPLHWIKNIFIKVDKEEPVALSTFLEINDPEENPPPGFFKKVFSFSKNRK